MMSALLTTAVDATAMFPVMPVVNMPVGINVIWPPVPEMGDGAVMVLMVVVPDTNEIGAVGAIVEADATVGAADPVATTPLIVGVVMVGDEPVISVPPVGRVTLVEPTAVNSIA